MTQNDRMPLECDGEIANYLVFEQVSDFHGESCWAY